MSNLEDAKTHARAIECVQLPGDRMPVEEFLKQAKSDWNLRGLHDPSLYVCAAHNASEAQIRASGQGDVVREFLPRVLDFKHDSVLEIGCGFGRMTRSIAEYCKLLWAIDISPSLVALAKHRTADLQHVVVVESNGSTLEDIPNDLFDIAFEYIVFQHIPAKEVIMSYIREVAKKLKVGGHFVMHGRDLLGVVTGASTGNTWHGCRSGPDLVREALQGIPMEIVKEEGVKTDRYWVTLRRTA